MDEERLAALVETVARLQALVERIASAMPQRNRLSQAALDQRRAAAAVSAEKRRAIYATRDRRRAKKAGSVDGARIRKAAEETVTSNGPVNGPLEPAKTTQTPSSRAWLRYASAFKLRYGVFPPRNARANGILAQLVARLGVEESPEIAEFYVRHDDPLYVRATHPLTLLLRDAEKLRTQWVTGGRPNGGAPGGPWWASWEGIQEQAKTLGIEENGYAGDAPRFRRDVLRSAAAWGSLPAEAAAKLGLLRLADEV